MQKDERFIRSINLDPTDKINLTDRWILVCLIKGLQGNSNISKISLDTINKYCQYIDNAGKKQKFGIQTIQSSIDRLAEANMIEIIKPTKRGQCTKYKIKEIVHFEKLSEEFFTLNLPPAVKGYLLCALQHNLNKDPKTHQPNDMLTKTTYNISELANQYNASISSIYRAEKILQDADILSITDNPEQQRDQETGLIIQNRCIDLEKIKLDEFVIESIVKHEKDIQSIKENVYTKQEVKDLIKEELQKALSKPIITTPTYEF